MREAGLDDVWVSERSLHRGPPVMAAQLGAYVSTRSYSIHPSYGVSYGGGVFENTKKGEPASQDDADAAGGEGGGGKRVTTTIHYYYYALFVLLVRTELLLHNIVLILLKKLTEQFSSQL